MTLKSSASLPDLDSSVSINGSNVTGSLHTSNGVLRRVVSALALSGALATTSVSTKAEAGPVVFTPGTPVVISGGGVPAGFNLELYKPDGSVFYGVVQASFVGLDNIGISENDITFSASTPEGSIINFSFNFDPEYTIVDGDSFYDVIRFNVNGIPAVDFFKPKPGNTEVPADFVGFQSLGEGGILTPSVVGSIPEPGTFGLMALGGLGLAAVARKNKSKDSNK